ncbi:sensor histidine kinase [Chitinophaga ginsengisoli]|uniref:sensor histidine kinase n=1 Tax=Chitinophaga ginsengisoli TaxID=363837 RepID=UPI001B804E62|nr:histidine kinase [Chitinophaga ginsengisoli]
MLYILLTHTYRNMVLRQGWHRLSLRQLLPRIIPADLLLGVLFMITTIGKIYLLREWVTGFVPPFPVFFEENWLAVLMAGLRLMTIWVLAYHLYHYAQREITIAKENARLEVISKEAQLNSLSAQLNPHFFFNSLNNIKSLIIENPMAARRAVDLLADLLRSSLYGRDKMLVTLGEEMDLVKDYLELEKLRLEERLEAQLSIDETLLDQQVPRLCIQTLVENAIKHGGGTIVIEISRKGECIAVRVQNPGKLDTGKSSTGLGLKNLRERMQLQYPGQGVFAINEHSNGIILATLLIPCV